MVFPRILLEYLRALDTTAQNLRNLGKGAFHISLPWNVTITSSKGRDPWGNHLAELSGCEGRR